MTTDPGWHQTHRLPSNTTLEQRIWWHEDHHRHCDCDSRAEAAKTGSKTQTTSHSRPSTIKATK